MSCFDQLFFSAETYNLMDLSNFEQIAPSLYWDNEIEESALS